MSLVNDMLRDLDRRKNTSYASDRAKVVFHSRAVSVSFNFKVLALMVMLGIMLGLTAGFYMFSPSIDPEVGLGEMGLVAQISGAAEETGLSALNLIASPEFEASDMALNNGQ